MKNKNQSPRISKQQSAQRKKDQPIPPPQENGLTIVGIGASAGGLKALRSFFEALPETTGMAFVVITHLHPEHESVMADILQGDTRMQVSQVTRMVDVEADHVYVIPPNHEILMADHKLDVKEYDEPRGLRSPVDHFFRSLAKVHNNSVGIILSGTGSDGSVGIKAIKEQGGLLMVQSPEEAEYDGMPRAAIDTGIIDVVLPVNELADTLMKYAKHCLRTRMTLPISSRRPCSASWRMSTRVPVTISASTNERQFCAAYKGACSSADMKLLTSIRAT
jgi:two-component system CheB/CheR fusion protein